MQVTRITWEKLERDCIELAKKIDRAEFDEIISISRGGMIVSRILSDVLDLPISHIAIESYFDLTQNKDPLITQVSPREFKNENILLVDELSDSGKTFLRGLSYLKGLPIKKICTVAPYYKPWTIHRPNFFMEELSSWIIFPYELKETFKAFAKEFGSEEKAKHKMKALGFKDWEILS